MKILSIGNSFSQDAQKWLFPIAQSAGTPLMAVNLYIGGCSLQTHWENYVNQKIAYDLEINGEKQGTISLGAALKLAQWDVITLQQASPVSGEYDSYQPYLKELVEYVRAMCPDARLMLHQTWSYDTICSHPGFGRYCSSQSFMELQVRAAYRRAARELGLELIPCGDVVRHVRQTVPEFDMPKGGLSLTRDGYHMSLDYGRYALGLTWFACLTGGAVDAVTFRPEGTEEALAQKLRHAVAEVVSGSVSY